MNVKGLDLLKALFVGALVASNAMAPKLVGFGKFVVPCAVVAYALTFLITDIIGELYGEKEAKETVLLGFWASILCAALFWLGDRMPAVPFAKDVASAYAKILGQNPRIVFASMVAYIASQNLDVFVFHRLMELTKGRHKWLRNNVGTMTAQFVDTVIFISIAFWGKVPNLLDIILSQYAVKVVIALLDTPIFYLVTGGKRACGGFLCPQRFLQERGKGGV